MKPPINRNLSRLQNEKRATTFVIALFSDII